MTLPVLHVVPAVADRYGGPSASSLGMVRALRAAGVEATLAATDADGPGRLPVETGRTVEYRGVPCLFFPRLPGESLKASPRFASWIRRNSVRFRLVHVHGVFSHPCVAAGSAARARGLPYVVRPLGQLGAWALERRAWRKRVFLAAGGARLLRGAAAVHFATEEERRTCPGDLAGDRGVVLPTGVDAWGLRREAVAAGPPAWAGEGPLLLFLGRLHPVKGLEPLLRAFGTAGAGWRLALAGKGEPAFEASLRRLAKETAPGRVLFPGWLGPEERAAALARADLVVLPSEQESFGLAAAEALALGVPVVVTRGVGLAEDVEAWGAGWVAGEGDGGLTRALGEAMASAPERRARGRKAASAAARRLSWESVAQGLASLYDRIAPGSGS